MLDFEINAGMDRYGQETLEQIIKNMEGVQGGLCLLVIRLKVLSCKVN